RPVSYEESTVQHEAERPILDLPAATPHPVERTATPPLEALPHEEPIAEEEGWDLDEPKAEGAEALAAESLAPELPQAPVEDDSVVAHEAGRPVSYEESTVQHEAERPILDLPAATPHPVERTVTPPLEALPHGEPATEEEGWDFDEPKAEGAEALAVESLAPELPQAPVEDDSVVAHEAGRPVSYDESTVQHEAERPILDLPAATPHPVERTATPPLEALPHEEPIAEEEGWDLDEPKAEGAEALAAESLAPELPQAPVEDDSVVAHEAGRPVSYEESTVQHEAERPILDLPAATSHPVERTVTPALEALPHGKPVTEEEGWDFDEPKAKGAEALAVESLAPESPQEPVEVEDTSSREPIEPGEPLPTHSDTVLVDLPQQKEEEGSTVQHLDQRPVVEQEDAFEPMAAAQRQPQEHTFSPPRSSLPLEILSRTIPSSTDQAAGSVPPPPPTTAPAIWAETVPAASGHERKESADGWGWDSENAEEEEAVAPGAGAEVSASREMVSGASEAAPVIEKSVVEEKPSAPPARKEKMLVSKRSKEIVKIAEEVLVEALTVASPSFEHPSFSAASTPLLQTFVSLLSLYRATAAVHNSTLLASVPAIGMQFANDADWIGREVERVWKTETEGKDLQVLPEQAKEVELAIQSTRQLGKDTRQKQIAIQRAALMESLDEANGFLRTSDDSRYAACERALQQVTHTLQRLALVWKPVVTPTALYTTLGGLVNEVLLRVLDEIEDQTDISEEESIRLNKLCKMLHELEGLFEGGEQTSVGREVPVWFKFVFLSELLEASMADILFLFDHGHLVDFSPQEIVKLIRALFADSPLRNRNIEKVLQGHPAVTPNDEDEDWGAFE
ncbi:hypothetical protein JCM1841_003914, partial [Sporobolomyces salmonicolor]